MNFTIHTPDSAPEEAKKILTEAQKNYGFLPNLLGIMASSPSLLEGYSILYKLFERTTFTPIEKHIVLLAVSYSNMCKYCVAAHTAIARQQNISGDIIDAIRQGAPLSNLKLEALRRFTSAVVTTQGMPSPKDIEQFLNEGYTAANILDVILGVGLKTLSNYTNHIADTSLDDAFSGCAWSNKSIGGD
ncbi:MAG: carboxymuconolactone decarboxylase family protein [Candidatus Berkiella sp.]